MVDAKGWASRFVGLPKKPYNANKPVHARRREMPPLVVHNWPVARSRLCDASLRQEWLTSLLVLAATIAAFTCYASLLSFYAEHL